MSLDSRRPHSRRERSSELARLRLFSNVRELRLRLIRSLPLAHPYGLRLCRSIPIGSIPAGNVLLSFARLRLFSNVRDLGLRLVHSLPLAHRLHSRRERFQCRTAISGTKSGRSQPRFFEKPNKIAPRLGGSLSLAFPTAERAD